MLVFIFLLPEKVMATFVFKLIQKVFAQVEDIVHVHNRGFDDQGPVFITKDFIDFGLITIDLPFGYPGIFSIRIEAIVSSGTGAEEAVCIRPGNMLKQPGVKASDRLKVYFWQPEPGQESGKHISFLSLICHFYPGPITMVNRICNEVQATLHTSGYDFFSKGYAG